MRPYHLAVLLMLSSACDADCDPASLTCSGFTRSSPAPQAPDASFEGVCEERDCVPIAIAAGAQHTCASILHDFVGSTAEGETVCWGRNDHHQVGPGDDAVVLRPQRSPFGFSYSLDASALHTCAVDPPFLGCWGSNAAGMLGWPFAEDTYAKQLPFYQAGYPYEVALGAAHACTLDDGHDAPKVRCFGDNAFDQLGEVEDPYLALRGSWITLPGDVLAMDAEGLRTCVWSASEGLLCWGREHADHEPGEVPWAVPGVSDPEVIALGASHACVIEDGAVRCWGSNVHGELGLGRRGERTSAPGEAVPLPAPARAVAVGGWIPVEATSLVEISYGEPSPAHTCALLENGEVWCWGANDRGQLGDGTTDDRMAPARVPLDWASSISAGGAHTCAIAGTSIHCWGANDHGQLGVDPGALPFSASPVLFEL